MGRDFPFVDPSPAVAVRGGARVGGVTAKTTKSKGNTYTHNGRRASRFRASTQSDPTRPRPRRSVVGQFEQGRA